MVITTKIISILGLIPIRGGGLNIFGRRNRLKTGGGRMEGVIPRRCWGHFYDNIEC